MKITSVSLIGLNFSLTISNGTTVDLTLTEETAVAAASVVADLIDARVIELVKTQNRFFLHYLNTRGIERKIEATY